MNSPCWYRDDSGQWFEGTCIGFTSESAVELVNDTRILAVAIVTEGSSGLGIPFTVELENISLGSDQPV